MGRIGGLTAKARAAERAGVEILFYPAVQRCEESAVSGALGGTSMSLVPVMSLGEAIDVLEGVKAESDNPLHAVPDQAGSKILVPMTRVREICRGLPVR